MELINRYVNAVGNYLPEEKRADIERELKSLILATLEDRTQSKEYSEVDVIAVLKEFGSPRIVAHRYSPNPRYLIGPGLFDTYKTVTLIVVIIATIGSAVSIAISIAVQDLSPTEVLSRIWAGLMSSVISSLGTVTIIFAILERVLPPKEKGALPGSEEKWDPKQLPQTRDAGQKVNLGDSIVTIIFTLVGLSIFNILCHRLGIYYVNDSAWQFTQAIEYETVARFLPSGM